MEISRLSEIPFTDLANCFYDSFKGYFVPINVTPEQLQHRWKGARIDYTNSFGAFENDLLVGFIVIGIDKLDGILTAFNAGTGVIPEFRGRRIVKSIYDYVLPIWKKHAILQSTLEVIQENEKAIKAYTSVGYHIHRELLCFSNKNPVPQDVDTPFIINRNPFSLNLLPPLIPLLPYLPSWENSPEALWASPDGYELIQITDHGRCLAYVVITPGGYIRLIGMDQQEPEGLDTLLNYLLEKFESLSLLNVDASCEQLISLLRKHGFDNPLNQYEMKMEFD